MWSLTLSLVDSVRTELNCWCPRIAWCGESLLPQTLELSEHSRGPLDPLDQSRDPS